MAFNVEKLTKFCMAEIRRFAESHQDELCYAFAIDANLLCLNSEEQLAATVRHYQDEWERKTRPIERWGDLTEADLRDSEFLLRMYERMDRLDRSDKAACLRIINESHLDDRQKGNPYHTTPEIQSLRENTGDWAYQGFAEMTRADGFDEKAYEKHYDMSEEKQKQSAYGKAMDALVDLLRSRNAFDCLKTAPTFYATRVEHNY